MSEPPAQTFGPNAWLVDEMYERYLADPLAVSERWREFFADDRPADDEALVAAPAVAPVTPAPAPAPSPRRSR